MHDRCCGNLTVNRRKIQIRNDPFPVLRSRRNVRIFTLVPTCCRNPVSYIYRRGSFSTFQGFLKFSTFMVCVCMRAHVCGKTIELEGVAFIVWLVKKDREQQSITCIYNKWFLNYKNIVFSLSFLLQEISFLTYFLSHLISDLYVHFTSLECCA